MIKVMVERRAKVRQDLSFLLLELRVAATMHSSGYVSGETLVDTQDNSNIVTLSSWRSVEDWKRWATSETRAKLYRDMASLLREKPKVRIFEIMDTEH